MKQVTKKENALSIPSFDIGGVMPDMDDFEVVPIDLMVDYWTPESAGETKRLFFAGVVEETKRDEETGEPYESEVAYFIEQREDGTSKQITNQSVRMVTGVKNLEIGTPLQITYLGKKRTQSGHNIDTWQINPLIRKADAYKKTQETEFDGVPNIEDIEAL